MFKYLFILVVFIFISQCSLDTKTGFWTKTQVLENKKENIEKVFELNEAFKKEFNPNLKIRIKGSYYKKPFINNLTNNTGYINFEENLKKISKFKFKKIKNFDFINPDILFGNDNSLVFFDNKGSILKFNQNSKLIWKKNHYDKKKIKQKPSIYFGTNDKILVAADSISNIYAVDYLNGNLLWKKFNSSPYNSEIKVVNDRVYMVDFENIIRCYSILDGKELWSFGTQKSFIKSQRKLSLIIHDEIVTFIDTFGDINALNANDGRLIWQSQTQNEDIFESTFLLKNSRLVYDNDTIYVSNNKNKFFAINSKNGFILWEQSINSSLEPTIIDNLVFSLSDEGYFFVIDKLNGNILRSTKIFDSNKKNKIYSTGFIVAKKFIYVSLSNGRLLKVSIEDGKTKNMIKIDGDKISRPYILNNQMYILKNNAIIKIN